MWQGKTWLWLQPLTWHGTLVYSTIRITIKISWKRLNSSDWFKAEKHETKTQTWCGRVFIHPSFLITKRTLYKYISSDLRVLWVTDSSKPIRTSKKIIIFKTKIQKYNKQCCENSESNLDDFICPCYCIDYVLNIV